MLDDEISMKEIRKHLTLFHFGMLLHSQVGGDG